MPNLYGGKVKALNEWLIITQLLGLKQEERETFDEGQVSGIEKQRWGTRASRGRYGEM